MKYPFDTDSFSEFLSIALAIFLCSCAFIIGAYVLIFFIKWLFIFIIVMIAIGGVIAIFAMLFGMIFGKQALTEILKISEQKLN